MKLPYGVADFYRIRTRGQTYVDRTDRIATVENLGDSLLFLRPRRFGKTLWNRSGPQDRTRASSSRQGRWSDSQ
jgi:hypothetical protein